MMFVVAVLVDFVLEQLVVVVGMVVLGHVSHETAPVGTAIAAHRFGYVVVHRTAHSHRVIAGRDHLVPGMLVVMGMALDVVVVVASRESCFRQSQFAY